MLGKYEYNDSIFHNANPIVKILWLIVFSSLIFTTNEDISAVINFLIISLLAILLAKMEPIRFITRLSKWGILIMIITFMFAYLDLSEIIPAIKLAFLISIKWVSLMGIGLIFMYTTNPQHMAYSLARYRLPEGFAFTMSIGFRMLPVIFQEQNRIVIAQKSRGMNFSIINIRKTLNAIRSLIIPLLISIINFSDELVLSLYSKGFTLKKMKELGSLSFGRYDWTILILTVFYILLIILFEYQTYEVMFYFFYIGTN